MPNITETNPKSKSKPTVCKFLPRLTDAITRSKRAKSNQTRIFLTSPEKCTSVTSHRKNAAGVTRVRQGTKSFDFQLSDPKRLRGAANTDAAADGIAKLTTQMPGKVVRVLTEKGAQVETGDGIIVVEAMKMQNEMKSPKDGTVKEIYFEVGATVNAGDVLAVIE